MSSRAERSRAKRIRVDPGRLARALNESFPVPNRYRVAFSGGLDSTVLLTALAERRAQLPAALTAVHVDHGLQSASADWAAHCADVCRSLDVPLTCRSVDARPASGESPEAAARQARYAAISAVMDHGDMLLTAHHRDDQAETVLLQLMRGAGLAGIAAMPVLKRLGNGWHARPMLDLSRDALRDWASDRGLRWIEDPTNRQTAADRNFLRLQILPMLAERWPAAAGSLAQAAGHAAAALDALHEQADADLLQVRSDAYRLDLAQLRALSLFRQRAVLLRWFNDHGLVAPASDTLAELIEQLHGAAPDRNPCFDLGELQLRRFRNQVCLIEPPPPAPSPDLLVRWPVGADAVALPYGRVHRVRRPRGIAAQAWANGRVEIRFRHAGFRCRPAGRDGHRGLKALAQEYAVATWQRPWLPLVMIDDRPAAVANCCVCEPFAADGDGWWIEWDAPPDDRSTAAGNL